MYTAPIKHPRKAAKTKKPPKSRYQPVIGWPVPPLSFIIGQTNVDRNPKLIATLAKMHDLEPQAVSMLAGKSVTRDFEG
jgi:hypothetical protein